MENFSLSYREVIPDLAGQGDCIDVTLNTGGTHSTLQDIKVAEKAGGYCYKNVQLNHTRNRYIYWRTHQDVLELSEVCLDFNLYQNNVRYKFSESPVIAVSISEHERQVVVLVITVGSLHRLTFPHPDTLVDKSSSGSGSGSGSCSGSSTGASIEFQDSQCYSIFREANTARDPAASHVLDLQHSTSNNPIPNAAVCYLSPNGEEAYFALAFQSQLWLYIMNPTTGRTITHQLKQHQIMPRLFSNLKDALTGKSDSLDADQATSLVFNYINGQVYLLAMHRNDCLRVWSTVSLQSVCAINCAREEHKQRMQGPQSNLVRKINETSVCVFISQASGAEFVCIEIDTDTNGNTQNISLIRRRVISAPQLDLVDFDVSETRIWALWSNAEGDYSVSNASLLPGLGMNWVSAAMEPPPDRYCVGIEQGLDPRQAYCAYIFHPGKFDRSVIAKALNMFRRSNLRIDGKNFNMALLKEQVCQAVEEEIQNETKEYEMSDDESLDIANKLWERFYSCCEQYHMKSSQPIGLVILDPIDAVCMVKKNTFSLLRPCEMLEHLMLAGDTADVSTLLRLHFEGNEEEGRDLMNLLVILSQLEKWLSEDVKMEFDKKMNHLESPSVLVSKLVEEMLSNDSSREILPNNFLRNIRQKTSAITNLHGTIAYLLSSLRIDQGNPEAMQTHLNLMHSTRFLISIGALFGSHVGLSLLSETVRQSALTRFSICRNLLIYQQLLMDTFTAPLDLLKVLRSEFMPDTVTFLHSYYVMVWICETPVDFGVALALETSIQRLTLLQLTTGSGRIYSFGTKCHAAPLLRVFLSSKGLYTAISLYAENFRSLQTSTWNHTLLPLTTTVCQLIWAVSYNFVFGEWLFSTCQHIIIQDYVRLLNNWCEWNIYSRQFILAASLLDSGETQKAYDLFLQSGKGVLKEHFLSEKILKNTNLGEQLERATDAVVNSHAMSNQVLAQYYLKVIQLFEQHNAFDHIISMSKVAIGSLDKNDPQLPIFQSIVFNNHLKLEHYEEAYHSLINNAELSRRKDCLRQLVVTLFDQRRLDILMHFPYVNLHEEFENIVESRARALSMVDEHNEIYDFLYAFHVNNGNLRKASAVMYEQAMRLKMESDSVEALQRRSRSLLTCMNALHLIDERYRWIVKPVIGDEYNSSTADTDSEMIDNFDVNGNKPQVIVLEIKDIRCEYLQTEALLNLSAHRQDLNAFINAGPQELACLLAASGLYTAALKLANGFNNSLHSIFEGLVSAYVMSLEENGSEAWSWLQENDLADIPHRSRASDMAGALLQKLIIENEAEYSTGLRKCVVNKLLSLNAFVPQWLYNDYKLTNVSELLRLYVKHNRLLEAVELATEMISAMLGAGSEYFSFGHSINVCRPELCLPVHTLDLLLHALRLNANHDVEYKQALIDLEDTIERFIKKAKSTAQLKIEMAAKAAYDNRVKAN